MVEAQTRYRVTGMDCASCATKIETAARRIDGVDDVSVSVGAGTARRGEAPDVVMACAGDVPTLETLAAVDILRANLLELKIRVVNVVDLMTLQSNTEHPHGFTDRTSTRCSPRTGR
jgi:phosphoketolase